MSNQNLILELNDHNNDQAAMLRFLEVVLYGSGTTFSFTGEELTGLGLIVSSINDHVRQSGQLLEQLSNC